MVPREGLLEASFEQTPEEMKGKSCGCLEHILTTEVGMRAKVLGTGTHKTSVLHRPSSY